MLFGKVSIKEPLSSDAACYLSLSLIVKVPVINHSLGCNTKRKKKKKKDIKWILTFFFPSHPKLNQTQKTIELPYFTIRHFFIMSL